MTLTVLGTDGDEGPWHGKRWRQADSRLSGPSNEVASGVDVGKQNGGRGQGGRWRCARETGSVCLWEA